MHSANFNLDRALTALGWTLIANELCSGGGGAWTLTTDLGPQAFDALDDAVTEVREYLEACFFLDRLCGEFIDICEDSSHPRGEQARRWMAHSDPLKDYEGYYIAWPKGTVPPSPSRPADWNGVDLEMMVTFFRAYPFGFMRRGIEKVQARRCAEQLLPAVVRTMGSAASRARL